MNWSPYYNTRSRDHWSLHHMYPFGGSFMQEYKVNNATNHPLQINNFYLPPKKSMFIPASYLGNGMHIFGRGRVYVPFVGNSIGCVSGKVSNSSKTCDYPYAGIRVKYKQRFNHADEITIFKF